MAIELEDFLETVVAKAANILQLQERGSTSVDEDDPIVKICAEIAYSQCTSFLRRSLIQNTFKELYLDEGYRFTLKNTPVDTVSYVWDDENTLLVEGTDYEVVGDQINLDPTNGPHYSSIITSQEDRTRFTRVVQYKGGYISADRESAIETALVNQTVVNYNRKDHMGLQQITAGTTSSRHGGQIKVGDVTTAESGRLFGGVAEMLSPYVYYGEASVVI